MTEDGMLYLILVCVVFLVFLGALMWGMLASSNLPAAPTSASGAKPPRKH